jgi:hypothetical protein
VVLGLNILKDKKRKKNLFLGRKNLRERKKVIPISGGFLGYEGSMPKKKKKKI